MISPASARLSARMHRGDQPSDHADVGRAALACDHIDYIAADDQTIKGSLAPRRRHGAPPQRRVGEIGRFAVP